MCNLNFLRCCMSLLKCSPFQWIWKRSTHEAEYLDEIQTKSEEFSSLLLKVPSTALPWDFYFFKLTQPLTVSAVRYCTYTLQDKGGKSDRKPHPLTRNPYRNLKFGNSQDYAQKPQRNCRFMKSASGYVVFALGLQYTLS